MNNAGSHKMYNVRSAGSVDNANFIGVLQYEFIVPEGYFLIGNESYCSVSLQFRGRDAGNNVIISNAIYNSTGGANNINVSNSCSLNSSPGSCLFERVEHLLNDNKFSEVKDVEKVDQIKSLVFETKKQLEKSLSTNPIYYNEEYKIPNVAAIGDYAKDARLLTTKETQYKNARKSPYWFSAINRLNFKLPLPFFDETTPFYSGTRHTFNLFVDNNFRQKIVGGDRAGAAYAFDNAAAGADGTINLNILDMSFYFSIYKNLSSIPRHIKYEMTEIFSTMHLIKESNIDRWTCYIPPSSFRVIIGFIDRRQGTSTLYPPNDFSNTDIRSKINQLFIEFQGVKYPGEDYYLAGMVHDHPKYNDVTGAQTNAGGSNVNGSSRDNQRAYFDYILASGAFLDGESSVLNYNEWQGQPLFCFNIIQGKNKSGNLDIQIKGDTPFTQNNLAFVMCLYNRNLEISYNESGFIEDIKTN